MNEQDCNKMYNKGLGKLKTSFFSFKFSPDYVGAIDDFLAAGKGFRQLGKYGQAITCFKKAIECNHKINDYYAEGNIYVTIADIYFFDQKTPDQGVEALTKASYSFQVGGKFSQAIKSFVNTAEKFMENKEYETAEKVLNGAFDICYNNTEQKLIGATFEQIYNKLLDVLCGLKKWGDAVSLTQKYIDGQLKYPEKDTYRLSKTFMKMCILRIITGEEYLCEDIFMEMFNNRYEDTATDIADIRKCLEAIKNLNKKNFTYCISSAFTLFENNLLKGLQAVYKKKEEQVKPGGNEEEKKDNGDLNVINTNSKNNNIIDNDDDLK